jgi:hypothetical protein
MDYHCYMTSSELFPYCEICPIIKNPQQQDIDFRIYEGENWRVTLRDNQALLGEDRYADEETAP